MQRSILVPYVWEHAQMVDYSVPFEVYDIKVDVYSKLNEYREIDMYQNLMETSGVHWWKGTMHSCVTNTIFCSIDI